MIINEVISKVKFNLLSDELIINYVKSGSPLDKAGAYGIQDNETFNIVEYYEGSYDNIVGFPVDEIKLDLEKIKK
jgi:septum formation protein